MKRVFVIGLGGESLFLKVDHFHKIGETVQAQSLHSECGGKGYNQAVALQRFGANTIFLSAVGNDNNGDKCIKYLLDNNIDAKIIKKDLPTPLATILIDKNGENQVTVYNGAISLLNENDVDLYQKEISESDILLLQLEVPLNVNLRAMEIAKKNNVKVILNPAPAKLYSDELLQKADIITPNEEEARTIFKLNDNDDLEIIKDKMKKFNIKEVIVTIGSNGALHFKNGKCQHFPGVFAKTIDTTGAGDIFNAMLAYQLSMNKEIEEAIKYANVCASISTTKKGVMEAIPSIKEVEAIINNKNH